LRKGTDGITRKIEVGGSRRREVPQVISGEHGIEPSGQYTGSQENQLEHINVYYTQAGPQGNTGTLAGFRLRAIKKTI
jgi:hypothetical protein